jgi:iron complex transport system substrate-binding protein
MLFTTETQRTRRGAEKGRNAAAKWGLILAAVSLLGCTPKSRVVITPPTGAAIEVTDDLGRKVSLPGPAQRIVTLSAAHTETLYAIGAGPQVVAADTFSDTPAEVKPKAVLTCWPKPSLEKILSYRPDLVVVLTEPGEFIKQMDAAHTPVLKLLPATFNRALEEIRILGKVSGHADQADKLADAMQRRLTEVRSRVKGATPRRFMYEMDAVDPAKPYVAGSGGFYGDLISLAGGKNVFDDVTAPSGQVSAEQAVARNPEVILLGDTDNPVQPQSREKVRARPGWNTIEAVKSDSIYPVDNKLITHAGPRMVDGVEMLARLLYPERFPKPDGK